MFKIIFLLFVATQLLNATPVQEKFHAISNEFIEELNKIDKSWTVSILLFNVLNIIIEKMSKQFYKGSLV